MVAIAEGSVITGKYRLERPLARGGMGSVWIGRHLELGVTVAVKFIDSGHAISDNARTRFKREAKAAAQLKTPHVVQVYDYGVQDETPYIVMELLEGEDLGARLKREGRLSVAAAAAILAPVCKAVHRAHEIGLVHRDLKPANIFLARQDDEVIVKVLDFGIAKWSDPTESGESTKSGTMIGSPFYMSPEQARSLKELDHRSDLWSIGVIAFQALTGQVPFAASSLPSVIMAICADPIPVASAVAPDLGPELDQFFKRALARDPAQRFQSARELAEALVALSGLGQVTSLRLPTWSAPPTIPAPGSTPSSLSAGPSTGGITLSASNAEPASTTTTLSPPETSLSLDRAPQRRTGMLLAIGSAGVVVLLGLSGFVLLRGTALTPDGRSTATSALAAPSASPELKPTATASTHTDPPDAQVAPTSSAASPATSLDIDAGSAAPQTALSSSTKPKQAVHHSSALPSAGIPRLLPSPSSSVPATAPTSEATRYGIY